VRRDPDRPSPWHTRDEGLALRLHTHSGITALSDYSSGIIEDLSSNGMVESLVLFESIVNSQWFVKTAIVSGSPPHRLHPFCC
jgi:hypothetical protein